MAAVVDRGASARRRARDERATHVEHSVVVAAVDWRQPGAGRRHGSAPATQGVWGLKVASPPFASTAVHWVAAGQSTAVTPGLPRPMRVGVPGEPGSKVTAKEAWLGPVTPTAVHWLTDTQAM